MGDRSAVKHKCHTLWRKPTGDTKGRVHGQLPCMGTGNAGGILGAVLEEAMTGWGGM